MNTEPTYRTGDDVGADWPSVLDMPRDQWSQLSDEEKLKCQQSAGIFQDRITEGDWPPTDDNGNEFPRDWIDPDAIDESGMLTDDHSRQYRPFAGNLTPRREDYACNVPLNDYMDRYGEMRYCALNAMADRPVCVNHRNREGFMVRAKEVMQAGFNTKTKDHLYNKLDPAKRIFVHGVQEDLMGESHFEFAPEYVTKEFDYSESELPDPEIEGQDGPVYAIDVPYATEHVDRALSLFVAACMTLQRMEAQAIVAANKMRTESTVEADYTTTTVPSESGGEPKSWQTIEEYKEHYLNLPLSRVIRDRPALLEYGGVAVESTPEDNSAVDEFVERLSKLNDEGLAAADPGVVAQGSETVNQLEYADDVQIEDAE